MMTAWALYNIAVLCREGLLPQDEPDYIIAAVRKCEVELHWNVRSLAMVVWSLAMLAPRFSDADRDAILEALRSLATQLPSHRIATPEQLSMCAKAAAVLYQSDRQAAARDLLDHCADFVAQLAWSCSPNEMLNIVVAYGLCGHRGRGAAGEVGTFLSISSTTTAHQLSRVTKVLVQLATKTRHVWGKVVRRAWALCENGVYDVFCLLSVLGDACRAGVVRCRGQGSPDLDTTAELWLQLGATVVGVVSEPLNWVQLTREKQILALELATAAAAAFGGDEENRLFETCAGKVAAEWQQFQRKAAVIAIARCLRAVEKSLGGALSRALSSCLQDAHIVAALTGREAAVAFEVVVGRNDNISDRVVSQLFDRLAACLCEFDVPELVNFTRGIVGLADRGELTDQGHSMATELLDVLGQASPIWQRAGVGLVPAREALEAVVARQRNNSEVNNGAVESFAQDPDLDGVFAGILQEENNKTTTRRMKRKAEVPDDVDLDVATGSESRGDGVLDFSFDDIVQGLGDESNIVNEVVVGVRADQGVDALWDELAARKLEAARTIDGRIRNPSRVDVDGVLAGLVERGAKWEPRANPGNAAAVMRDRYTTVALVVVEYDDGTPDEVHLLDSKKDDNVPSVLFELYRKYRDGLEVDDLGELARKYQDFDADMAARLEEVWPRYRDLRQCGGCASQPLLNPHNSTHVENQVLAMLSELQVESPRRSIERVVILGTHLSCAECSEMLVEAGMRVRGTKECTPGDALRSFKDDKRFHHALTQTISEDFVEQLLSFCNDHGEVSKSGRHLFYASSTPAMLNALSA